MDQTSLNEVRAAVSEALKDLNLVDLKRCHEELTATREALLDMQQNFLVWQELARMRGDENQRLKEQIEQLREETTQLRTELVLLRAAYDAWRGDAADGEGCPPLEFVRNEVKS